jgi:hypothetical protein
MDMRLEMDMKKFLLLSFLSFFAASQANAGFIKTITGADMAGIEVTVTYANNPSETLTWQVISAGNGLTDTVNLELAEGGVTGTGFKFTQQGDSQGNIDDKGTTDIDDDELYGLWTIINTSTDAFITSLFINTSNTNIVFDSMFDDIYNNGSGPGRNIDDAGSTIGTYSVLFMDELYTSLMVDLSLNPGESLVFFADTDAIAVSAPTTVSILLFSLLGLIMNARRKQA